MTLCGGQYHTGILMQRKEDSIIGYGAEGTAVRSNVGMEQFQEDLSRPEEFVSLEDFQEN